eukprot:s913_g13.t1
MCDAAEATDSEWYDVSKEFFANLQRHGLPSPYKEDEDPSPFRALLGDDPSFAKPDPAHTYAIDGWGKSLCASGLILIYRLKIIKGRSLQVALDEGFEMFKAFCLRTGKQSSICYFAMKTLRIDAILGTIHGHPMIQTSQDRFLKGVMRQELQRHFLAWSHVKRLNISTAAELLTVAKAKQQLGKDSATMLSRALRLKDHVVHHVSKTITFVRLKDSSGSVSGICFHDIWLAWLHQVLLHRLEKTQDRKDRSHRKEIQRIRREAADEHTALGERMHSELEQVGRESHLRDMLLQWQAVVKNMRSHRNYHGEMDQIRQEAAQEVKQKEKKTVEQLSSFAIHSAELLIRRRMKDTWEREKYQQHAARMQQEAQDQRDHHQNVLQSKETKKEVACWQLATFSYLVRERVIIRLAIFHYWREASMWSKKAHLHHLRRQGQEIASHSKEVSLLVTQMLAHQRDLSLLTKAGFGLSQVMVQWKQVVEREANQRSLEHKDEENVERVKTSVHNERVAGSKRAQVLVKWLLHLELQNQAKWLAAWSGEVKYAKIVRKMEGDKEAHDLAMVEVLPCFSVCLFFSKALRCKKKSQMVLMRYFPAFIFMPYMNHSEAHLQKTIEKIARHVGTCQLDKKRERQIADLYKLRRKSVADAGEVLHVFRGQRENQLILSLVLVIWSEVISDQMAMRRWNEQREVKLELERSLQELKDKTWHLRIDTKKVKDLTDTCRHMGETGQLLMELSTTRAWGCWRIWHLQEVHSRVQAKANNHTEARVMAERMKVQQRQKKDEVVMSNIMVAAGEVSSVKFSFRAWEILTRKEKEHRHKTNMRQDGDRMQEFRASEGLLFTIFAFGLEKDHKKELYELRQDTVAKLRRLNRKPLHSECHDYLQDMQQVLRCFVCWCTDVKAGKMATDLLVAEEKKRQEVQQDLTVEMSARKTAESEARTATELLHNNGIQFPTDSEAFEPEAAAAARPERFMLPVERVAQALQKVYRRRLTTALVAMLTTSPRKMAWYSREPGDRPALADNPKAKRKAQSTAKPAASKAAAPAMLALPAPAATPGAPGGVASTLDFLARTRQLVASSFDADAMAPGGRDTDDGFGRQGNGYPVPSLPRFGAHDAQVPPPESPGAFERPRMVAKPRPDSAGPHLVITGVKSPPAPPPSTAAGPTLPTRQTIEQQINLQDTLTHMQDTMRRRLASDHLVKAWMTWSPKSRSNRRFLAEKPPSKNRQRRAQSAAQRSAEREECTGHAEQDDKNLRQAGQLGHAVSPPPDRPPQQPRDTNIHISAIGSLNFYTFTWAMAYADAEGAKGLDEPHQLLYDRLSGLLQEHHEAVEKQLESLQGALDKVRGCFSVDQSHSLSASAPGVQIRDVFQADVSNGPSPNEMLRPTGLGLGV